MAIRKANSTKKTSLKKSTSPFELKDACYHKIKKSYKVFPSAYASGAIAKCRKAKGKKK
tara:strand:- start:103 stop:279 length:177 start_codon:yes stop_codon:yes gene_type:complete